VLDELKIRMIEKRSNVCERSRGEIVDTVHAMALLDEPIAQVRPDEAGASRHHDIQLRGEAHCASFPEF
jgi:hypothetical protein